MTQVPINYLVNVDMIIYWLESFHNPFFTPNLLQQQIIEDIYHTSHI